MKIIETKDYSKNIKADDSNKGAYNPYAVCTDSVAETAGTRERSEWTKDQKERYDQCINHIKDENKSQKKNKSSNQKQKTKLSGGDEK